MHIVDVELSMHLQSCKADGRWFGLTFIDAAGPAQVGPLLEALRRSATDNVGGSAASQTLPVIVGTTPNPRSARLRIAGKLPDGRPLVESALFFVRGLRVYQASVVGDADAPADVLDTFFASIRVS